MASVILSVFAGSLALTCAYAAPSAQPTPAASATTAEKFAAAQNAATLEQQALLSFLGEVVNWYDHLAVEQQIATGPAETLFLADDRQMAGKVVNLAFEYARARAALIGKTPPTVPAAAPSPSSGRKPAAGPEAAPASSALLTLPALTDRLNQVKAALAQTQGHVKELQARMDRATRRQRNALNSQLVTAQGEVELARSRIAALNAMIEFETSAGAASRQTTGLIAQIDELAHSIPQAAGQGKAGAIIESDARVNRPAIPSGILDLTEKLLAIERKGAVLDTAIELTNALTSRMDEQRAPLAATLRAIDRRATRLAVQASAGDLAGIQQRKRAFDELVELHKLNVAAILPLAKATIILNQYVANLQRWRQTVDRRGDEILRILVIRLIVLGTLLALIVIGAIIWRRAAFRYIQDTRHRHRILQVRTLTVAVLLALVVLFNFSNEIGALATVMGLATAGIAFALQNVILSVAGYFFLSGRYGVRVGDRIQLAGVYGTVIDIGLVKLTLMELSGEDNTRQPSGRIVVFANSIVFQSNGNLFKPAPGLTFVWNELSLTLAPDCDHQLAERLLTGAVNDVFVRYRDQVRREYRETMRHLNLWIEPPEPQSRLLLGPSGIKVIIRYPVEAGRAIEVSDEISRRLLNVINHEPRLRLVSIGTPAIQAVADSAPAGALPSAPEPGEAHPPDPGGRS